MKFAKMTNFVHKENCCAWVIANLNEVEQKSLVLVENNSTLLNKTLTCSSKFNETHK